MSSIPAEPNPGPVTYARGPAIDLRSIQLRSIRAAGAVCARLRAFAAGAIQKNAHSARSKQRTNVWRIAASRSLWVFTEYCNYGGRRQQAAGRVAVGGRPARAWSQGAAWLLAVPLGNEAEVVR